MASEGAKRRCVQCYQFRAPEAFLSSTGQMILWCNLCRKKYKTGDYGERASIPRRKLPIHSDSPPLVKWTLHSKNEKLGDIPVALISAETCPPSCGFYGRGCYHEFGLMGHHWRQVKVDGIPWRAFLGEVERLPPGTLWRYATGGDLPGNGDKLDVAELVGLVMSNRGRRGFTFTHKPLSEQSERNAIAYANKEGFTVNLSADSLVEADRKADLGVGPVVVVLPTNAREDVRTPAGRRVVICPYETHGITCAKCQLCSRPNRTSIVGFVAHGQMATTVSKIVGDES